jgi:hypothetical protein
MHRPILFPLPQEHPGPEENYSRHAWILPLQHLVLQLSENAANAVSNIDICELSVLECGRVSGELLNKG